MLHQRVLNTAQGKLRMIVGIYVSEDGDTEDVSNVAQYRFINPPSASKDESDEMSGVTLA